MPSILRPWVSDLPLRHQGTLIVAIRGCDNLPRENSAKPLIRALRYAILHPAAERELDYSGSFMAKALLVRDVITFTRDWNHYPLHFIQHLMHAAQIVGYKHPDFVTQRSFAFLYALMVDKLHLKPESEEEMDLRLTKDRIATYGNATGERQLLGDLIDDGLSPPKQPAGV